MRLTHGVLAALVGIGLIVSLAPASGGAVTAPRWEPTALCAEPGYRPPAAERATILLPDPSGDGVWTSFPAPTTTPNRICAAIIDDYVNNKIYMAGGTEAGQAGAELSNFQRFDPITNSWQNMASMPAGRTWIDGQGSFIARLGKIYICCGMTGSGISNNNCWEYDIANNTWATRATAPTGQLAYASGVWRDSLIYIMGGYGSGSGSNGVQIYNPFTNAWTTGTAMPENGDMGSACIIGDTIYVTNFYNRASNALWANARKGAINPANPTQITWSTWTSVPSYGFNGGTAALGNKVYRLGGFSTLYVGSDHLRGWVYDPRMGTSESLPWLPYPTPYRRGLSRCNFLVGCERTNELMVSGGDEYGDWSAPNNYYYRNQFTPPHNITCYAILTPSGAVDSGQALVPTLVVRNSGAYTENYKAFMSLPGGYMDTVEQTGVPGGRTDTLTFTPWIPQGRDSMATLAYTTCDNDSFYGDDTLRNRFLVRVKDVAVTAILNPVADTLDSGVVVWPRASVWNYGNQTQSFPLQFRIGTYLSTASVVNLIPGGQQEIVAPESLVTMPGIYIHQVTAVVAGDLHPENNVKTDTFVVRGTVQHNIAATMLIAPVGAYDTTMTVVPACSVANLGTVTEQFWTFLYVREPGGSIVYSESTQTMLGAGGRLRLQFNPVKFTTIGVHSVVCSTYCFGDQNGLDDIIRSTFRVFAELAGDVGVVQILQ
ncbi:hypothetical protein FJY71_06455, partial [candidate division WOR-3 bacterium]|nr:hypothetical protein [candidate division WOR-3 bacterium]